MSTDSEKTACAELMSGSEPWTTLGLSRDQLMSTLNDPLHEVHAAYVKEELVGTIVIHSQGSFSAYLKNITVKPSWRGQKLGEKMMEFIENEVFSTYKNLFLCVSSFNTDAQRFYRKMGYQKIGELKDYLVEGHDEILMRKSIAPIVERK